MFYYLMENQFFHIPKYSAFDSMCDFPGKDIKLPKWSCALNFCSEFHGVFVPNEEINDEGDLDLPFV